MNGMAGNEDHDAFSDDDFSNIPNDELQRLEQDAITFTQQDWVHVKSQQSRPSSHGPNLLNRGDIPAGSRGHKNNSAVKQRKEQNHLQQDLSDATIFDEDGLPLVVEEQRPVQVQRHLDEAAQRERWRVNRFAPAQSHTYNRSAFPQQQALQAPGPSLPQQSQPVRHSVIRPVPMQQNAQNAQNAGPDTTRRNVEEDALRAKIAELLRERDQLTTDLHGAQQEIFARRGEILNVRAKHVNEETTHQRQIAALQRIRQEDTEKHSASIQTISAENAKIVSEMQFLKQELKEESRKVQAFQKQLKERPFNDKLNNVNTTPKRNHALRDGFDDDEMMVVSPVKSGRRSNKGTPTANRKRKQPADASLDIQSLPLRLSGTGAETETLHEGLPVEPNKVLATLRKDHLTERHLHLIQKVTSFRPAGGREVLIESLFKLNFPSDPNKSLGFIAVDAMARLSGERLPAELIQIFIDLWSRAKNEQYYVCLPLLNEAISFCLDREPHAIDVAMLDNFLPTLQSTIEINATARFRLMKKDYLNNPDQSKPEIDRAINNTSCLELLHTFACFASDDRQLIDRFWRKISTDFVLVMLNACQPIQDIILMLQITATSILPDTFGMICDVSQQNRFETYICDRVCFLLWEPAKPDADKPAYSQKEICGLRQESLNLLAQLTIGSAPNPFDPSIADNHGTIFMANHPSAIARLVRCIYDELAVAYQMTPTQKLHTRIVNTAVRILHFVLFSPAGHQVAWQDKFGAINGIPHKFRVVMARLAYADGAESGIDAGITEDTVRMATELLEESVTPGEVDDLVRVFEGESSNSGKRTSTIGSTQR